ncbi:hypothetical protein F4861DRAFT_549440 [Xylaria intraflava]|nr:hypothetical protein F4861DRAFT_549440 [Xylaria intraflava]
MSSYPLCPAALPLACTLALPVGLCLPVPQEALAVLASCNFARAETHGTVPVHCDAPTSVTIPSIKTNSLFPSQSFSALPSQVELKFEEAIHSSRASFQSTDIPPQDFPVFTTDSNQSPWPPPSSSQSQPAPSAQQFNYQNPPQQDFVLFDSPQPPRTTVNRTASSSASTEAAAFGSLSSDTTSIDNRGSAASAIQSQRLQQIFQATGHQFSPSALTNRHNSFAQNHSQPQFFAPLSAPSVAQSNRRSRVARSHIGRFPQGLGNQQTPAEMDLQGNSPAPDVIWNLDLPSLDALSSLEGFTAFGGGASTAFSPAISGCDLDVDSASSPAHLGTVSPGELLLREQFSAPNSSAFTNLTTPSNFGESPEFESYEVSPNFGDLDAGPTENWFPLFPESTTTNQAVVSTESPTEARAETEITEPVSQPRKSSNSPSVNHGRHSSVSGVNSRRRDKPLPPIVVDDPNDTVAMKRARNTLAARKSRERKAQKMEELEEKIAKLVEERDHWKRLALSRPSGV